MTNTERIVSALRNAAGLSDSELRRITGIEPHQQVNQICHRLASQGIVRRQRGPGGIIVNTLAECQPDPAPPVPRAADDRNRWPASLRPQRVAPGGPTIELSDNTLVVVCCSSHKAHGGSARASGRSVIALLDPRLSRRLLGARSEVATRIGVDEARRRPAWQRYIGTFYRSAEPALGRLIHERSTVLILSGGYGLVHAEEPIGSYNRSFHTGDWPPRLIEECLAYISEAADIDQVLGFCANTSTYAKVVRRTRWPHSVEARLITPKFTRKGGAQMLVPRALGQALVAMLDGPLRPTWTSTDGLALKAERLR